MPERSPDDTLFPEAVWGRRVITTTASRLTVRISASTGTLTIAVDL